MEPSTNFTWNLEAVGVESWSASMHVAPGSMEATNYPNVFPPTSMEVRSRLASMEVAPA